MNVWKMLFLFASGLHIKEDLKCVPPHLIQLESWNAKPYRFKGIEQIGTGHPKRNYVLDIFVCSPDM